MNFDRKFLDSPTFEDRRNARDFALRELGVDPDEFRDWQRVQEVENETGTDEYRETQPSKGLGFIAEFMDDWAPGVDACNEMMELVKKWIDAGANMGEAYSGADELVPILNACFDFKWAMGGFSLYRGFLEVPDEGDVELFKEDPDLSRTLGTD